MPLRIEIDDETAKKCRELDGQVMAALMAGDLQALPILQDARAEIGMLLFGLVATGAAVSASTRQDPKD